MSCVNSGVLSESKQNWVKIRETETEPCHSNSKYRKWAAKQVPQHLQPVVRKGINERKNVLKLAIPTKSGTLSLATIVRILITVHMVKADKLFSAPNSKLFHKQHALGLSLVTVCPESQDSARSPVEFLVKTLTASSSGWRCFQDSCSEKFLMSQVAFSLWILRALHCSCRFKHAQDTLS